MAHRKLYRSQPARCTGAHRLLHDSALAPDNALVVTVEVGDDHIAVELGEELVQLISRRENSGHQPRIVYSNLAHLPPSRGCRLEGVGHREDSGGDQCGVLAQGVAHHQIGSESSRPRETIEGRVQCQHGRLRDGCVHQSSFSATKLFRVFGIDKKEIAQRAPQNRGHHFIGLGKHLGHERLRLDEVPPHVQVLASLTWKEEGELARPRTRAAKDASSSERGPSLVPVSVDDVLGDFQPLEQLARVFVLDDEPFWCRELSPIVETWSLARGEPFDGLTDSSSELAPAHSAQGKEALGSSR